MKPKIQKQLEALTRLEANITRIEAALQNHRSNAKTWQKPVLTAKSTAEDRRMFLFLPQENPFLKMVELDTHHLEKLERERQVLKNVISNAKIKIRYV